MNVFNNVILARNRQLPDDDRMIEICRSIFKSFNIKNLSVCIGWCTDQVSLRSARCNDKDKINPIYVKSWKPVWQQYGDTYTQNWIMHKRQKMGSHSCKFIILIFIYSYQFWSVVCIPTWYQCTLCKMNLKNRSVYHT